MKQGNQHSPIKQGTVPVWPTAAKRLGIGKNSAYEAVKSGQLPVIRIGRRLLVPLAALERLLDRGTDTN